MRDQSDVREVLHGFHLHEGIEQGGAEADGTVVLKQHGVVLREVWGEAGGDVVRSGGGVARQGDGADRHAGFLAEHLVEGPAGTGEGRCDGRVGMDDGTDVVSTLVDCEVHAHLTGRVSCTGEEPPMEVDDDHVGPANQAFADAGGRDEKALRFESDRQVPGRTGSEAEA